THTRTHARTQTNTHTDRLRQTHTHTDKHTHTDTDKHTHRHTHTHLLLIHVWEGLVLLLFIYCRSSWLLIKSFLCSALSFHNPKASINVQSTLRSEERR